MSRDHVCSLSRWIPDTLFFAPSNGTKSRGSLSRGSMSVTPYLVVQCQVKISYPVVQFRVFSYPVVQCQVISYPLLHCQVTPYISWFNVTWLLMR
jgi:hypothetical protein